MRRKSETTRRRIIDAAYECFWRAGYTRTSLETIAERAGLTKRTLYGYFRSKDDLLAAVMAHHNALAGARLKHIGDRMPPDRDGLIESFFGQLAGWASAVSIAAAALARCSSVSASRTSAYIATTRARVAAAASRSSRKMAPRAASSSVSAARIALKRAARDEAADTVGSLGRYFSAIALISAF